MYTYIIRRVHHPEGTVGHRSTKIHFLHFHICIRKNYNTVTGIITFLSPYNTAITNNSFVSPCREHCLQNNKCFRKNGSIYFHEDVVNGGGKCGDIMDAVSGELALIRVVTNTKTRVSIYRI